MSQQITLEKPRRAFDWGNFFMNAFPAIGLVVVIVFFTVVTDGMLIDSRNVSRIISQALPLLIGTIGASFVFAQNLMDLSMGSVVGLSAACAAYTSHLNPVLAIVVALGVGASVGFINGVLHGVLKINPIIATMAVSFIIRGLLQPICNYGSVGLSLVVQKYDSDLLNLIVVLIVFVIAYILFEFTGLGKKSRVVGSSEIVATQSGINVRKIKITGYVISGLAAGLAGLYTLLRTAVALPATGNLFEFDVIIALVLGGMPISGGPESRIRSAVIGTLLLTVLTNGMTLWGIAEYPQEITKGVAFLVVLAISFAFRRKK